MYMKHTDKVSFVIGTKTGSYNQIYGIKRAFYKKL